MRKTVKKWAVLGVGWTFIVLGVAGLFLPILQGILFLLIGLIILSSEYVWAHHLLEKIRQRFPKISQHSHAAAEKARRWLDRIHARRKAPSAGPGERSGCDVNATSDVKAINKEKHKPGDSSGGASAASAAPR